MSWGLLKNIQWFTVAYKCQKADCVHWLGSFPARNSITFPSTSWFRSGHKHEILSWLWHVLWTFLCGTRLSVDNRNVYCPQFVLLTRLQFDQQILRRVLHLFFSGIGFNAKKKKKKHPFNRKLFKPPSSRAVWVWKFKVVLVNVAH